MICNVYIDFIMVYDEKTNLIARHNKKDGKGEYSIDIRHYLDTFLKKPGALRNSLALRQAPKVLQTIFHEYFITEPKKFLELLMNSEAFDDPEELAMEYGIIGKRPMYGINPKCLETETDNSIDDVSRKQLEVTAQIFGQKEQAHE